MEKIIVIIFIFRILPVYLRRENKKFFWQEARPYFLILSVRYVFLPFSRREISGGIRDFLCDKFTFRFDCKVFDVIFSNEKIKGPIQRIRPCDLFEY